MSDLAQMVQAGDPDRHAATLAAPEEMRARLWTLYAFNLEVARAPWVTQEPMIAEMRLQFWRDTLDGIAEGQPPRAHEVASPLAQVWRDHALPVDLGHAMIDARRWDIGREGFSDAQALAAHLEATSGNLMWLAALTLGAGPGAEQAARDMAYAAGLASWFLAVPELTARGRQPLPDPSPDAIRALAEDGLTRLKNARAQRATVPTSAAPALLTGWQAGAILRRVRSDPARVAEGRLGLSEFARRSRLLARALSGRW